MDKILRRVRMAEGQVARRTKRREVSRALEEKRNRLRDARSKEAAQQLRDARMYRMEQWKLGDLAPRRELNMDGFGNYWGTISVPRTRLNIPITNEERRARSAWCGGPKFTCLRKGDRVVVTEGSFRDKIGIVDEIDKEFMVVALKDDLRTNVTVPDYMNQKGAKPVQIVPSRIPVSAVRLVHPLPHPETGKFRDVIIRELKPINILFDRPTREVTYDRLVPGENVTIPWPKEEPVVYEDHPNDTLRIDVEERTYVPTLLRPPMPETIVDELRNRYSKFRTRHTEEYIAQKEAEEAAKNARKKSVETMMTPVQEFNRHQRELRRARGQPDLTPEMLEKIGEVIARNRERRGLHVPAAAEQVIEDGPVSESVDPASIPETTPEDQPRA